MKKEVCLTNAIVLSTNQDVVQSLQNNDRTSALKGLSELARIFKEYTVNPSLQIHIHTKDIKSFI